MRSLNPGIKRVADRIYNSDPVKFKRLVVWIKQAEKYNYSTPVIVAALLRFEPYAKVADPWYPYLDKIIKKVEGDFNMGAARIDHERHKEEIRELSKTFGPNVLNLVKTMG